jgi:hypothetical protein
MSSPSVYELSSKNGSDAVLAAANGTYIVNNTSTYAANPVKAIVVLEDTIFDSFAHVGNAADVKSSYIAATGTALKAGAIIRPIQSKLFRSIKLTSGSVILVL